MVSRELASKLLGSRVCAENADGEDVCIYVNARSDNRVFVKVVVDGETVAKVAVRAADFLDVVVPIVLATTLSEDEIEELWSIVKRKTRREKREEKTRRKVAKKTKARRRVEEEPEEEVEEAEEEEERGEEEDWIDSAEID